MVLYVREARPGERIGPHRRHGDKVANARLAVQEDGKLRTVLVDDQFGTPHHLYGATPHSVDAIDAAGVVVFRAMWNAPDAVETVLRLMRVGQDPGIGTRGRSPHWCSDPAAGALPGGPTGAAGLRRGVRHAGVGAPDRPTVMINTRGSTPMRAMRPWEMTWEMNSAD